MNVTDAYVALAIINAFALFFILFGGVEEDEPRKSKAVEHRLRKKG